MSLELNPQSKSNFKKKAPNIIKCNQRGHNLKYNYIIKKYLRAKFVFNFGSSLDGLCLEKSPKKFLKNIFSAFI